MNKSELTIVVLLFLLLMGWFYIQPTPPPPPVDPMVADQGTNTHASVSAVSEPVELVTAPSVRTNAPAVQSSVAPVTHQQPEQVVTLENTDMKVEVSSWGGAIKAVTFKGYRVGMAPTSGPVRLDFNAGPALALNGGGEWSTNADFELTVRRSGLELDIRRITAQGLKVVRTLSLDASGYRLQVADLFENTGATSIRLPGHSMQLGPMQLMEKTTGSSGVAYLGADLLPDAGGERVKHLSSELPKLFGYSGSWFSCGQQKAGHLPPGVTHRIGMPMAWAAVKNKFFVQILAPAVAAEDCELNMTRNMQSSNTFELATVSAGLVFGEKTVEAGQVFQRDFSYYVGPKLLAAVRQLGQHQEQVMEFGFFKPVCELLLPVLNGLYGIFPNYGVAIILVTILVKVLFWPITRKSTQSMKKMQELQPLVAELRTKYKDKPQKVHEEMMLLYKKHKVNPMSGCLPMLVQIPVFIALFTVLRSAVELRFADFLWIRDLSEPENLLAGVLPIPLNILPILMTVTMVWQQNLMPSSADPQQKKMMTYMSVIMLFMFYNMASALLLYWSVSQAISIGVILIQRWRQKNVPAAAT